MNPPIYSMFCCDATYHIAYSIFKSSASCWPAQTPLRPVAEGSRHADVSAYIAAACPSSPPPPPSRTDGMMQWRRHTAWTHRCGRRWNCSTSRPQRCRTHSDAFTIAWQMLRRRQVLSLRCGHGSGRLGIVLMARYICSVLVLSFIWWINLCYGFSRHLCHRRKGGSRLVGLPGAG